MIKCTLQHFVGDFGQTALSNLQFIFLEEIWQMPPISESRAEHNTGNYDPYFFQ